MTSILLVLFTIVAGVMSGLESGSNNALQMGLRAPWWTVAIVAGTTFVAALAAVMIARDRWPDAGELAAVPWYGWIGGVFALVFVSATVFAAPKLGAGTFLAIIVTASTVTSIVLDHYGLMQFPVHPAGAGRIAGAVLMIAGVVLIAAF